MKRPVYDDAMTEAEHAGARRFSVAEMDALVWYRDDRLVWAEAARASSSYGSGWSADAVVGRPDVYPRSGDIAGAWAPATFGDTTAEWIEVDFEGDVRAREVWVFETNLSGRVYEIDDRSAPDAPKSIWSARSETHSAARVLVAPIVPPRTIRTLRLQVDVRGHHGWPEIDAVALVRDVERGSTNRKVNWRKKGKRRRRGGGAEEKRATAWLASLTTGAKLRLAAVFAIATAITWSCVAPRGLVVSEVAPARVDSAATWTSLANDVRWGSASVPSTALAGAPDARTWIVGSAGGDRVVFAEVSFAGGDAAETSSIVLVESRPFAVVRIDDVSSALRPVTIWRGATTQPRGGDHGAIRIDLAEPRAISRLRLVVDRQLARGSVDAVGLIAR